MIRKQAYVSFLLALVLAFGCICPAVGYADSSMDVLVTADNCKDNSGWYPGGTNDGSPLYNDYVGSFGDPAYGISRCELKFDLSSVAGQITGVQLALFEDNSYSNGSPDLIIGGSYDDAWPLSSGADAYIPAVDETNLLHDTTIDAGWNHFESAQLTQFIVNQANGDKTATLILEGSATSGDNYFGFHSTNNADHTIWPRLIVTYNPVVYAYSAAASAVTASPIAGAADAVTLTVKDSTGAVDTTFSGAHNVTITGYEQAPDESFGSFGGTTLNGSTTQVSLNFTNGVATADLKLNKADPQTIAWSVADLSNAATNTVVITPAAGNTAGMKVTTDVTAPAANGGPFAQQPVVTLVDSYGNTSTGDNSTQVTASEAGSSGWTLAGTKTVTASSGVVTFTDLGADNDEAVNGAQVSFQSGSLPAVTSAAVNLPAPAGAQSATASAAAASPVAGAANAITLNVLDAKGHPNTTFSGTHDVTVTGYGQAPGGSFGSFGGTALTAGSTTVSLNFTSGTASADLALDKAGAQTIAWSVAGVAAPDTNTVDITPAAGPTVAMNVATQPTAPAANGGPFAQQPVITLVDAFGNTNTSDNATQVTASEAGSSGWTLTGTKTVTASSGVVTFTDLGADNDEAVNGAQVSFQSGSLPAVTSAAVNLPAPAGAQTVMASAATDTPAAGAANVVTLNVLDAKGHIDTSFNGAHNVTITGYGQAPGGSFGSFGGTALSGSSATVSVTFSSGTAAPSLALDKAGAQTIAWSVAGVAAPDTNTVDITPAAGPTAAMNVVTQPTAPAANGGPFAQQPVITLVDAFGNTNTSDNATQVTASEAGSSGWTLTGTATATASAGVVSFTDLGAANDAAVTGAQVAFDAAGLVQTASLPLNLPAPAGAQSVAVSAQTVTPAKGEANTITFTVKDSLGHTDTGFSGAHSVTISGYAQAPDGTYGSFGETTLNGASTAVSLTFTSGTASAPLKLNKAGGQTISFSVTGVQNPAVSVVITPKNDAPAAADDGPYVTNQSTPLTVAAADGVLRNDTDADSDNLTAVLVSDPSHGSLVLNPDGSFTYSPDAGFYGTDQFTYKANDGQADSNPAAVSIRINDTIPPDSPGITLNPSGWTNGTVTATVYGEPGGTFEYRIGSDPGWTAYTGPVSLTAEGEYPIEARQTDDAGNVSGIGQATVRIDKTAPVITLNGDDQMTVYLNETFTDPGAAVTDNLSTGLQATAVGSVNTHTLGNYVIHYQAADLAGNAAAEKTRTVHVIAKPLGLSFNATEYTVQLHQTIPFSVAMNYSDGSSVDVTASSSYTFNPEGIASIPSVGVLSGDQAGSTVVKAVYGTDSATVNVVVNPLSANADLSSLTLSSGTLSPAFSPSVTAYDVTVKNAVSSVTVTAAADDPASTVSINGAAAQAGQTEDVPLHVGRNKLNVIVTSPSGGSKTYSLDIWRNNPSGNTPGGPNSPATPSAPSNPNPHGSSVDIVVNGQVEGQIGTAVQDTAPNGQTRITYMLDEGKLSDKLDQEGPNAVVTIPVDDPFGQIIASVNGQIVSKMGLQGAVLRIQTKTVTYTLPIRQLNLDRVMHQLGIDGSPNKLNVFVNLANLTDDEAKLEAEQETKAHLAQVAPPIAFSITATNGDKTIEIDRFDAYVSRTFMIPGDVDPAKITTGVVWKQDGTFYHVPTKVTAVDGHYEAEIHSLTNSTYAVVYHAAAFPDVERHWSKAAVNNMASRLIISGRDDMHFDPDGTVTRSEFIAIVARAMGLASYTSTPDFTDVVKSVWYYDPVAVGVEYELISGYADHTFKPNEAVTREEAMLMMARAAKLAGQPVSLPAAQQQQLLGPFKDASDVGSWAREAAAYCVQEGIVMGSGQLLHPQGNLTRAEAAAMTLRLLTAADLI